MTAEQRLPTHFHMKHCCFLFVTATPFSCAILSEKIKTSDVMFFFFWFGGMCSLPPHKLTFQAQLYTLVTFNPTRFLLDPTRDFALEKWVQYLTLNNLDLWEIPLLTNWWRSRLPQSVVMCPFGVASWRTSWPWAESPIRKFPLIARPNETSTLLHFTRAQAPL